MKRRKADDEHLIRKALLDSHLIDAVISLPLNVFYGAGVPACLLFLRKDRPADRRDKVLLVYAARHYRELSNQNELRPQDVMRILVHYHAYGDAAKVPTLVAEHSKRIHDQIDQREQEEVMRIEAEYQEYVEKLERLASTPEQLSLVMGNGNGKPGKKSKSSSAMKQQENQRAKAMAKLAERDEWIAEVRRRAEDDRHAVVTTGDELITLYADPDELLKHARVVSIDEIEENECNLNIPRYVDTFEPEPRVMVAEALIALRESEASVTSVERKLTDLLAGIGYITK
jgi:type I restriction enzyme M protein